MYKSLSSLYRRKQQNTEQWHYTEQDQLQNLQKKEEFTDCLLLEWHVESAGSGHQAEFESFDVGWKWFYFSYCFSNKHLKNC